MTFTFDYGTNPTYGYKEIMDLLATGIYGGAIIQQDQNTYQIESGGKTFTFTGTGFTYGSVSGQTLLFGGLITGIAIDQAGASLGTLSNLTVPAPSLTSAFLDELFGFDPLALENLFLTQDWVFNGNDDAQVLTDSQTTNDNFPYSPSGNDTAYLLGGNDVFALGAGDDTAYGGNDNDKLYGGTGNDKLYGGHDDDSLYGGDGLDSLYGGNGRDKLFGGKDDDFLSGDGAKDAIYGYGGNDVAYGGSSQDRIYGGDGKDDLYGGSSHDVIFGGSKGGTDRLFGGTGNDKLFGGNQADKLWGDDDDDLLYGGIGNDYTFGGAGNDTIYGDRDKDRIYGGDGDDLINGGTQDDRIYGGAGADHFEFSDTSGNDTVYDYNVAEGDTALVEDTVFVGVGIFADSVVLNHTGGSVTFENLAITNVAEYNAFLASVTIDFA